MPYLVGLPSYKNLTEATQLLLARCQAELLSTASPPDDAQLSSEAGSVRLAEWRPNVPPHVQRVQAARHAERSARYQHAVELNRQGKSAEVIGSILGVTSRTVQRWLTKGVPNSKRRRRRPGSFENYASYVLSRWEQGERNGLAIYREIKEQGYDGSERTVYRYLEPLKQAEVQTGACLHRLQKFSSTTAVWLFVREPKHLDEIELEDLAAFCQVNATLKKAYDLIQDFLQIVALREGDRLEAWLDEVQRSGLAELQSFAYGIQKDKEAVRAGLTWEWSNDYVA